MSILNFLKIGEIQDINDLERYYGKVSSTIKEIWDSLGFKSKGVFGEFESELVRLRTEIDILKSSKNITKGKLIPIYKKLKKINTSALTYASMYQNQYRVK